MVIEGRTIVLDKKRDADKKKGIQDFTPQIMVFANGDLTSFELTLERSPESASKWISPAALRLALRSGESAERSPTTSGRTSSRAAGERWALSRPSIARRKRATVARGQA